MRFIDNFDLFELTNYMTEKEFGLCVLNAKLEAFSLIKTPPIINLVNVSNDKVSPIDLSTASESAINFRQGSSSTSSKMNARKQPTNYSSSYLTVKTEDGTIERDYSSSGLPPCPQRRRSNSSTGGFYSCRKPLRGRATSLGDLGEPSSRRLLFDLISTLDEFFPDYDFDTTKPEQFQIGRAHV